MPIPPTEHLIERRRDLGGNTLYFMIRAGSRSRRHRFFEPHEVPEFDGESAVCEIERGRGGHWKVLRVVEASGD